MWSLVSNASVVVQLVMLVLVAASVTSWVMIFQRSNLLRAGRRALESFEERFWSGIDLSKLYRQAGSNPDPDSGVEQIFRAGFKEFSRLRQQPGVDPEAVMEGVARAMRVAISREEEKLEQSLPFLATVGSVSPYIGLFGTVWGIMNSFRGLAQAQQATLATVAATLTRHEGLGIGAQVLLFPTLGPEMLTDSAHAYGTGYWLELDHLRYDYGQYLAGADPTDPRVSPLLSTDLAASPPAIVVVASCDPLRDEAVAYAGLLEHYGVRVELLEAEGMVHGFIRLGGMFPEALAIVDDLATHMHRLVERP
jgi:biopolymer transport protein TolQ